MPRLHEVSFTVIERKDKEPLVFADCADGRFFVNCFDAAIKKQIFDAAANHIPLDLDVRSYKEPSAGSFTVSAVV